MNGRRDRDQERAERKTRGEREGREGREEGAGGRRRFVSCAAHVAVAAMLAPRSAWARWAGAGASPARVVAAEPFGRLESVADGVWALVSTPLSGDRTTLSNGGLIAGRHGVLAVEGFMTTDGARWLGERARELTGRWPTHVAVTHYHADHVNGVAGYHEAGARPAVHVTGWTRETALERNRPSDDARSSALRGAEEVRADAEVSLDLGGRRVRLVPRAGHTASDLTIEVDDPSVVFTGDLVWNAMFPNYVDASPGALSRGVRALRRQDAATVYVPGHGAVARDTDIARYLAVLDEVEQAARAAHSRGVPPAEAAAAFALPAALGEWLLFNRVFYERAFAAWKAELDR